MSKRSGDPIDGNDAPLDMLRRRPDIIAAERRLAASNERIGVAISDYYPKVSLSGVLGFDSLSLNHLFTAKAFQPVGSGALRWRLFDFGKVDAEVDALARVRDLSQRAYQAGSITLTDVLDANRQLLTARDELDANRAAAAQSAVSIFRALGGGWDATPGGAPPP